jgi:hypothetical protein
MENHTETPSIGAANNQTETPSIGAANNDFAGSATSQSIIERARNRISIRRQSAMNEGDLVS